jgi:spore coat protein JB
LYTEMTSQDMTTEGHPGCGMSSGALPGACAPLAFPYVPMQGENPQRYTQQEALQNGTLFPGLNLPFRAAVNPQLTMEKTALAELMALDFAIDELGLYLVTHPEDQEVLELYWSYIKLAQQGRKTYEERYGPLLQTTITENGYSWINNPWPWDLGGES